MLSGLRPLRLTFPQARPTPLRYRHWPHRPPPRAPRAPDDTICNRRPLPEGHSAMSLNKAEPTADEHARALWRCVDARLRPRHSCARHSKEHSTMSYGMATADGNSLGRNTIAAPWRGAGDSRDRARRAGLGRGRPPSVSRLREGRETEGRCRSVRKDVAGGWATRRARAADGGRRKGGGEAALSLLMSLPMSLSARLSC